MKKTHIEGAVGALEIAYRETSDPQALGVICHPDPSQGGTMDNKVVTTIVRAWHELGVNTVRFNFRGVGKSEGTSKKDWGEVNDCQAVLGWAKKKWPDVPVWLAGFSFGSFIAAKVATLEPVNYLLLIAPPIKMHYPFHELPPFACPWTLVQGGADKIVPVHHVMAWHASFPEADKPIFFPKVGHFFHGHLVALKVALQKAAQKQLSGR